jgi:N-acetylglutamate synthase-like GNAT family acetyltransferase
VVAAMREVGIDLSAKRPQELTDALARDAQMLITMGCADECPVVPGARRDDWPLEDPKGKSPERVREIRDEIRVRVASLVDREGWGREAIRPARAPDLAAIEALLSAAKLPVEGVAEHLGSFLVLHDGRGIRGAVGIEPYGDAALLRSVVVAPDERGRGRGVLLTTRAIEDARVRGARAVFLLTTTAAGFFPRFGFERVERSDVPGAVMASRELQGACPATAIVMMLRLPMTVGAAQS